MQCPPCRVPRVGAGDGGSSTTKRFECKRDPYPAPGQASCSRLPGEIRDGRAGARRCHRGGGQGCGRPPRRRRAPGGLGTHSCPHSTAPCHLHRSSHQGGPLGDIFAPVAPHRFLVPGGHAGAGQETGLEGGQAGTSGDTLNQWRATAPAPHSRHGVSQSHPERGVEVFFGGATFPESPPSTRSQSGAAQVYWGVWGGFQRWGFSSSVGTG